MPEYTTETGRTLIPESRYKAMINSVKEKKVREYTMYEWSFEAFVDGKPFYFGITLFSSQMGDLLRALKAEEVTTNRFKWTSEGVIGHTLEFTLVHVADKKGVLREQLSDIQLLSAQQAEVKTPADIAWEE